MKIYKYVHSCILLEEQGRGLLFDPGMFTFMDGHVKPDTFFDLDAVVITHIHGDHLDVNALKVIMGNNPQALILTNRQVAAELQKADIAATVLENGTMQAGVFNLEALPAPHERTILADAFPDHAAYRINGRVIHPGDSLSTEIMTPWMGTEVLIFPVTAPWMNEMQAYVFAKAMKPAIAIPAHDGYLKEFFQKARYQNYTEFLGREGITFISLTEVGQAYELA
jgi:L-ascorbate metabolism protein UlaG (beta-lactamase superfamily)